MSADITLPASYTSTAPRPFNLPRTLEPNCYIKPELIQRPSWFVLYFGFLGTSNWRRRYNYVVLHDLDRRSLQINRPLRQEELDFTLEALSGLVNMSRTGLAYGALTGNIWALYKIRRSGILMYAPKIPGTPPAVRAWQGVTAMFRLDRSLFTRIAAAYAWRLFWGMSLGWLVADVSGAVVAGKKLLTDERMRPFREENRNQDLEAVKKRFLQGVTAKHKENTQGAQFEGGGLGSEVSDYNRDNTPSPTPSDSYTTPASYTPTSDYNQQQDTSNSTTFLDDASPVAPDYNSSSSSRWDRIRQQTQSQDPSNPDSKSNSTWSRLDTSNTGTSSGTQQDRNRAQDEFNRLLEAERNQPGDSDSGSGRKGGWP
ncbi:hypothetical protein BJX70DRAFT_136778 [Aspergillus crustosus]